jgi:hypothetical protein
MLEARINGAHGSLYYAAEATAYNLETLLQHLRECQRHGERDVALELTLVDDPDATIVDAWLASLSAAGYRVNVRRQRRGESER